MKKYLLIFFISILLFPSLGLAVMNHEEQMSDNDCPFQSVGMTHCFMMQGSLNYALTHLGAFSRSFSGLPVLSLLSVLIALVLSEFIYFKPKDYDNRSFIAYLVNDYNSKLLPVKADFFKWQALHENSPSPA